MNILPAAATLIGLSISLTCTADGGTKNPAGSSKAPVSAKGVTSAKEPAPPPRPPSEWRFSAGYAWRSLGDLHFDSGSRASDFLLPRMFGSSRAVLPSIGTLDAIANRTYADGYVRIDSSGLPDTWFWGYQNASQVSNGSLNYTAPGGSEHSTGFSGNSQPGGGWDDEIEGGGLFAQLEYLIAVNDAFRWGPQVGFMFFGFDSGQSFSNFMARESFADFDVTYRDRYALRGVTPPPAPYAGTSAGPGPLIQNIPSARTSARTPRGGGSAVFFNNVDESLELDLYTFSHGISAEFRRGRLYANIAAGLALNIVNWEAAHHETLSVSTGNTTRTLHTWNDRTEDTDFLLGAYVQGMAGVQLTRAVSLNGFFRYDWCGDVSGTVGPSSFDAEISGLTAGVALGVRW